MALFHAAISTPDDHPAHRQSAPARPACTVMKRTDQQSQGRYDLIELKSAACRSNL